MKIDDKMTTTESITQPSAVTMEDEDNIIFLDEDKDGQDAGLMFSPVIAEPELQSSANSALKIILMLQGLASKHCYSSNCVFACYFPN